jgi:hypothetical protein
MTDIAPADEAVVRVRTLRRLHTLHTLHALHAEHVSIASGMCPC